MVLKEHFPNIYEHCLGIGIDITKDMIPVVPAAHYLCGGIKVDMNGQSSIDRLIRAWRGLPRQDCTEPTDLQAIR
jgi:L-aspartate oxidase